ncbi:hypothetical protein, partial [Exiguobacterium sp. s37]|uniref:hypothetical protein n=1 Tax=Exiguobacterium sp. s37 TaxID=2751275 RepID=UPI001BE99FFD
KATRTLKRYYILPSRIRNIELQIQRAESKVLVASYEYDTVKQVGTKDPTARITELKEELDFLKEELELFEQFRSVLPEHLAEIWERVFNPKYGYNNEQVMIQLNYPRQTFYKYKNQLFDLVEETFQ